MTAAYVSELLAYAAVHGRDSNLQPVDCKSNMITIT